MAKNITKETEALNAFQNDESNLMDDFAAAAQAEAESAGLADDEIMDVSFDDVYDEEVHPTGAEVKLICTDAVSGTDKNGATYWRLTYEDANNYKVKAIRTFIGFPKPDVHTPKQVNNKKKSFMTWKQAHGIDLTQPVRLADCKGLEAWAILRQVESEEYGVQNEVKSWILPR